MELWNDGKGTNDFKHRGSREEGVFGLDRTRMAKNAFIEAQKKEAEEKESVYLIRGEDIAEDAVGRLNFKEEITNGIRRRAAFMASPTFGPLYGAYAWRTTVDRSLIDDQPEKIGKNAFRLLVDDERDRRIRRESSVYLEVGEDVYLVRPSRYTHSVIAPWTLHGVGVFNHPIFKEGDVVRRPPPFIELCIKVCGDQSVELLGKAAQRIEEVSKGIRNAYEHPNIGSLKR